MIRMNEKDVTNNVLMENQVRMAIDREARKLLKVLKPYDGQKVTKVDGSFLKKIEDQISFDREAKVMPLTADGYAGVGCIYYRNTDYSITLIVKLSWSGGTYQHEDDYDPERPHYSRYREQCVYLAEFVNDPVAPISGPVGKVMKLNEYTPMPMLGAETELKAYNEAFDAKEKADEAIRQLKITDHREDLRS